MHDMLKEIVAYKQDCVKQLKADFSFDEDTLKEQPKKRFFNALAKQPLSLIAELKKASPSKGVIVSDFDPVSRAKQYEAQGASALSVLTDERYFQGHNNYLKQVKELVSLPLLRKEFIIDPIQVYESKCIGADAILLILGILSVNQAQDLLDIAASLGLDVLVEVHGDSDLKKLEQLKGVSIVGVNNRDLDSFVVDTLHSLELKASLKALLPEGLLVAESGYNNQEQLQQLEEHGFDAVLIGEGLASYPKLLEYFNEN